MSAYIDQLSVQLNSSEPKMLIYPAEIAEMGAAAAQRQGCEGIDWEMATETDSDRTIEATIGADLAICVVIEGTEPPHMVPIQHGGVLPEMPISLINMYGAEQAQSPVVGALAELLRQGYSDLKSGGHVVTPTPTLREVG